MSSYRAEKHLIVLTSNGNEVASTHDEDFAKEIAQALNYQYDIKRARREIIATAVMAGFASDPQCPFDKDDAASEAVAWADALIAELGK